MANSCENLEAALRPLGDLIKLSLVFEFIRRFSSDITWAFEQTKVEERLGREITAHEKEAFLAERLKGCLSPQRFRLIIDDLVTDPGVHSWCDKIYQQMLADERIRQIARDLAEEAENCIGG